MIKQYHPKDCFIRILPDYPAVSHPLTFENYLEDIRDLDNPLGEIFIENRVNNIMAYEVKKYVGQVVDLEIEHMMYGFKSYTCEFYKCEPFTDSWHTLYFSVIMGK